MTPRKIKVRPRSSAMVGKQREELIAFAKSRVVRAINSGFYLEAISLEESLIADRLESILSKRVSGELHLLTASQACSKLEQENIAGLDSELLSRIRTWSDGRAEALHEFVKLHETNTKSWRTRLNFAREIAEKGLELIREPDAMAKKLNRELSAP